MSFQAWWEAENISDTTFLDKENCGHLWEAAQAELRADLDKVKAERDSLEKAHFDLQVTHAEACRIGRKFQDQLAKETERITALERELNIERNRTLEAVARNFDNLYWKIHSNKEAAECVRALLAPTVPPKVGDCEL